MHPPGQPPGQLGVPIGRSPEKLCPIAKMHLPPADDRAASVREDVGRHNPGRRAGRLGDEAAAAPLDLVVVVVSGRVTFEIVQKAAVHGKVRGGD